MRDKIQQSRLKLAEHQRVVRCATPEAGTPFETVCQPEYWAHVARDIRLYDRFEVVPDDCAYYAELLVIGVGNQSVTVQVINFHEINSPKTVELPDESEYFEKFMGPAWKWCVIRRSDNEVMIKQLPDQGAAKRAAANYVPKAA